jgi:hypothetical protein
MESLFWKISSRSTLTTGIRGFTECRPLCRVPFVGHSAKKALPRAALGKVRLSATSLFTECWTLGTGPHSTKTRLPKHSAKVALGKGPLVAVPKLTAVSFCREPRVGTRQRTLCRVPNIRHSAKYIFIFLDFVSQTFCGMFLHYVDLHVSFVDYSLLLWAVAELGL